MELSVDLTFLPGKKKNISIDDRLGWRREYYVNEIEKERIEFLTELLKEIGWSLGWENISEDRIREVLKKNRRLPDNK